MLLGGSGPGFRHQPCTASFPPKSASLCLGFFTCDSDNCHEHPSTLEGWQAVERARTKQGTSGPDCVLPCPFLETFCRSS